MGAAGETAEWWRAGWLQEGSVVGGGGMTGGVRSLEPELVQEAAGLFGLLSSTTRLHIVWLLAHQEADVGALVEAVGGALPAVSQHLAKLKLAGLVAARREGRRQVYLIADPRVAEAVRHVVQDLTAPGVARTRRDAVR